MTHMSTISINISIAFPTLIIHYCQICFDIGEISLSILSRKQFTNAEPIDSWNERIDVVVLVKSKKELNEIYGLCGLDAINAGLIVLELLAISKVEALGTLSRTEGDVAREGLCINELECLLNTRIRSIALVDCYSHERMILSQSKYRNSVVNIGMDSTTHFIALSQE